MEKGIASVKKNSPATATKDLSAPAAKAAKA
jgi:uncharacterized protein YegP (UPF0339 family)